MIPFRLAIASNDLKAYRNDAEVILRVGAICNGVQTMGRALARDTDPAALERMPTTDEMYFMVIAAAYLKEFAVIMNRRFNGLGWSLLGRGIEIGRPLPDNITFDELRGLTADGSEFRKGCETIREKFAFHMDPEPFQTWLDRLLPDQHIAMFTLKTSIARDAVIDASVLAMRRALNDQGASLFYDVSRVCNALPYAVEAMIAGFHSLRNVQVLKTLPPP
jgi:hypothetical protein